LAFPDLGKECNLAGFVVGMPPKVTDNDLADRRDNDTSLHEEGFYRHRLTDNIEVTPGLFVVLNPEHNNNNKAVWVGAIRITFRF
jgi:carbohydrate-selective porin OprB